MVYILGGWQTDFAANWSRQGMEIADAFAESVGKGLEATGLEPKDIECGHVGNFVAELFAGQGLLGGFFGLVHPDFEGMPTSRRMALAMRWLIDSARKRGENTMPRKLAGELLDASENRGGAIKKREETHRMAEANKAFAHYRW